MGRLSASDYAAMVDFLDDLYRVRDAESFPRWLVQALTSLVDSNQTSWNRMMPTVPRVEVLSDPEPDDEEHSHFLEGFQRYLLEHPCVRYHVRTGSPEPVMISDFISASEFHRLAIYREVYRLLDVEDQIGFSVTQHNGETIAAAVSRDRRSFGERERALLARLRPHIGRAYDNACAVSRLRRNASAMTPHDRPVHSALELDTRDRPRELPAETARWLMEHFGDNRAIVRGELPDAVRRWLQTQRPIASSPLVDHRRGYKLVVRRLVCPESSAGTDLLLLERHALAESGVHLDAWGLTRREIEVLCVLEQGLTNEEIGARLRASPFTVKKHLEHIYRKLGVRNRTEAVRRLHGGGETYSD